MRPVALLQHRSQLHCSTALPLPSLSDSRCRRGPTAQLEGILTELQQQLVAIDSEKSDAAAALACAALVQQEALAASEAAKGAGAGDGAANVTEVGTEGGAAGAEPAAAAGTPAAAVKAHGLSAALDWAAGVCRGGAAATAAAAGGELEPPIGSEAAAEALRWSRFAVAPYGSRLHSWRRGKASSCAARKQLGRLASAAAAEGAEPLAGWGTGAAAAAAAAGGRPCKPSRAEWRSFAAARELLGAACQVVSFSNGDRKRGLLPHVVAVDRCAGG